jgi:predicted amidophosphoribosyltransferase
VIELIKYYSAYRERPLTDISSEPIARHEVAPQTTGSIDTESQAACPSCGVRTDEGEKYCRSCGADLEPKLDDNLCPRCGAKTYSGMKFCGECGISLIQEEAACPKCGADTKPIMIFCGECGHQL